MEECSEFIKIRKEARHFKTLNRQKRKIERLCHKNTSGRNGHSNIIQCDHTVKPSSNSSESTDTKTQPNKWVINISD